MELQMPRRRKLMARAPLKMGMQPARLATVDSARVCEQDIVRLLYCVTIVGLLLLYLVRLRAVSCDVGEGEVIDPGRCSFSRSFVCTK
jgi:hypothetical protein